MNLLLLIPILTITVSIKAIEIYPNGIESFIAWVVLWIGVIIYAEVWNR